MGVCWSSETRTLRLPASLLVVFDSRRATNVMRQTSGDIRALIPAVIPAARSHGHCKFFFNFTCTSFNVHTFTYTLLCLRLPGLE